MRRWPLLVLIGGLCLAHAAAGTPRFEVMNQTLDLGVVRPNSVTPGRFVILNTGDAPLRILSVKAHCGCTVTRLTDRIVPPGGQSHLSIKYTAGNLPEDVSKSIDLTTDDPATPKTTLYVTASVKGDIEWSPRTLALDWPVAPDFQGRITFRAADGIQPKRVYDPAGFLQAEWRALPGKDWEVLFRLPVNAAFRRSATLCVESNSQDFPNLNLRVYFQESSPLRLTPGRVNFWVREGDRAPVRRITVARRDGQPLKVLRAEPSRDYFVVTVVQAAGETAVIELTLKDGLPPDMCDGNLHIVTDVEDVWLNISCKVVPRDGGGKGK